jgi:Tfp pilus assembly protein PilP
MAWLGMMSKTGQPQALVMQAGLIHRVQVGQAMGQDWGEVVQIASDHLLLREWHISPVGQWQAQTTRFPLATKP